MASTKGTSASRMNGRRGSTTSGMVPAKSLMTWPVIVTMNVMAK